MENWISLVPFAVAIVIALATRHVLLGLTLGLLVGSISLEPRVINSLSRTLGYILAALEDGENLRIVVFLYVFGGLVGMLQVAGGVRGFAQLVGKSVKTERSALAVTWASVVITFMDCEFRTMTVGPLMKAVQGGVRISKSKLAYAIDVSTVPVIVLFPVATTYVGYMVSVVSGAINQAGLSTPPYRLFLSSLPFNFFAIAMVLIGLVAVLTGRYIGAGFAQTGEGGASESDENEAHRESVEQELAQVQPKPLNLAAPLALLLLSTVVFTWLQGRAQGATSLLAAFQATDVTQAMLLALFFTSLVSLVFFLLRRISVNELMFHFVDGGNQLMMAILLLVLVWAMAAQSKDLGFAPFVKSTFGAYLPGWLTPAAVFLFGSLLAYLIGSSWGTWGILMPLGVALAVATHASLPATVGAVFASGTFGDFSSPLGETTTTTAAVFDLPVVSYARKKLPSALAAVAIATALFAIVGLRG